jgi:hypothetical protein
LAAGAGFSRDFSSAATRRAEHFLVKIADPHQRVAKGAGLLFVPSEEATMIGQDPSDPLSDRELWVPYILGALLAFEGMILVISLIWL